MKVNAKSVMGEKNNPAKISRREKQSEITIIPMVSGSFKKRALIYPNAAVITTRMVIMARIFILYSY
jgi:hypothetical protein